ncbi:MAG: bifunctional (p)ppGpp synthetase/guanosine-3',5'-bis(diphosphate) 3'-pyrophosphohydrolase [Candidatus Niyogibacteria bacterium]|nr:bifunctional (p)ppGpp synthetase/guanosine-3',5'-bis(diphosphate) 3'-pyrophosphohydrolase [Candidatus Niyogibacteria bacterium]
MSWEEYTKQLDRCGVPQDGRDLIKQAFLFAHQAHENQTRFSGEPYVNHTINVSLKVAALRLNAAGIAAALLHDTVEDDKASLKTIRKKFGPEVALLVNGLTKVKKIKYQGVERQVESMRKMFLALAEDIRVVIIKLMDRMHNMETLEYHPKEEKRKRIALETLEIYAPLADRLGMWNVKSQLEDLAFKYVYPEEYKWITEEVKEKIPEREKYLETILPILKKGLNKEGVRPLEVSWRAKHYYSIWKKLSKKGMDWGRIKDLAAMRIIVKDIEACYATLGVIHTLWRPLPGRIKDYIALPKPNGYQSLHTTVFCENGKITEFQIRTPEMHRDADFGIAAHWAYEMAGKKSDGSPAQSQKFAWVRQLQEWQKDFKKGKQSSQEFLDSLKIDFFKDRIFALTPKGDVIDLPEDATPIDFAYHIHSEIGDQTSGCKVNGRMVPLSHSLKSGDVVEMLIQKNKKPSQEWLELAKTSLAKNRIRSAIKKKSLLLRPQAAQPRTELVITAANRVGLIKDISAIFAGFRINIESIKSETAGTDYPIVSIVFTPKNEEQTEKIKTRIKKLPGIENINLKPHR